MEEKMMEKQPQFRKGGSPVIRTSARRGIALMVVGLTTLLVLAISLSAVFTPARAQTAAAPLCGDGSAPDYGLSYDLNQPDWVVGWQDYASERTVGEVDDLFDQLDADSIA
jgi:hypothetical protein